MKIPSLRTVCSKFGCSAARLTTRSTIFFWRDMPTIKRISQTIPLPTPTNQSTCGSCRQLEAKMETHFMFYPAEGHSSPHLCDLPAQPDYYELRKLLIPYLGPDFERVRVFHNEKYTDMFVLENMDGAQPRNEA